MEDVLSAAFTRYAELVRATLGNHHIFDDLIRTMKILPLSRSDRIDLLPQIVQLLETGNEFHQLLEETPSALLDPYRNHNDDWTREWINRTVQNFFRRSGVYLNVFEGKRVDVEEAFETYKAAFKKQEVQVRSLLLLNGVKFASSVSCMKFDKFQIRRFSGNELAEILGNRINQVFYQDAVVNAQQLQNYWYVSISCAQPYSYPISLDFSHAGKPEPEYKRLVREFSWGSPQHILILFPWEEWDEHWHEDNYVRCPCDSPFILHVDDDFLSSPQSAPNLPGPLMDLQYVDPDTGEEIWSPPFHFNANETEQFKAFVQRVENLFKTLRPRESEWEFFEIALAYFMKAIRSTDLEELLWHIIALEALLGENVKEGAAQRIARRISLILGNSKKEREQIGKKFKELWDFRCDLVHGNKFEKEVLIKHLTTGRIIARKVLLWFLHYLYAAQPRMSENYKSMSAPSRDLLLAFLSEGKDARQSLHWLTDKLPPGFPHVAEWIG